MNIQKIRKDIIAKMHDDPDGALDRTNELVAERSGEVWVFQLRSSVYEVRGEIKNAIQDLDTVIKLKPNEPSPFFSKASIYFNIGEFENAIFNFSNTIRIGQELNFLYFDNHSHFMRAFCYCRIGDFDSAKLDLEVVDDNTRTWTDRLWTKENLVSACRKKRMS